MVQMISQDALKKIFAALGAQNLSPEDQQEILPAILDHFNDVITETFIHNLDDENLKIFKALMKNPPSDFEEHIERLAARIPGLAQKIQEAVQNEIEVVKTMYETARI